MLALKDLYGLLSILFAFLVVDDEPAQNSEFGQGSVNRFGLENVGRVQNVIEHMMNAVEIA